MFSGNVICSPRSREKGQAEVPKPHPTPWSQLCHQMTAGLGRRTHLSEPPVLPRFCLAAKVLMYPMDTQKCLLG